MPKSTLSNITGKIQGFSERPLEDTNPVFATTQHEIISLIDKYWMSRFDRGDFDRHGQKKPFFNIIETPVLVAGKLIDLDTKDPRIIPENGSPLEYAMYFEKELGLWMKDSGFAKLLNKVKWMLPKYGTVVLKKFKNQDGETRLKFVPLQNLHVDSEAESLKKSHFIIEEHRVLPRNLRNMGFDEDRVNEAIAQMDDSDKDIRILEHFGDLEDYDDNFVIVADVGDGVVLETADLKKPPYYELHWDKVPGRWLGVGLVEKNFEAQIHMNRVQYLKSNGLHWTSKHIFQTQDDSISKNLLVDVEDGQVIRTRRDIQPVAMEERNLSAYREEENVWLQNVNNRSFSQSTLRGALPPSGTPLGSVSIATQQASSFFENKREEFGQFIKDILWDVIIPEFKKKNRKEHWMNMINADEQEMKRFDKRVIKERVFDRTMNFLDNNGTFPDPRTMQMMEKFEEQQIKNAEERWAKIPESFYENLDFKIELVITGESQNLQSKLNGLQIALQTAQSPSERRQIRNKLLQLIGEEPPMEDTTANLTDIMQQRREETPGTPQPRTGGSQPRIRTPNQTPGTANTQQTL